ncbi:MAG: dipeptide epimerase [Candidatus Omnitrophica bacterium]|nr:dipeptide epimerase [Candidatus Omnitrophota bacterium]MDE2222370.1 dipeptide epimerase [Candidatus Omnitrophota bacterium]
MTSPLLVARTSVKKLRAPLSQPFRVASGQHDQLDNLLFVLHLKKGLKGCGEAAVATHITGETLVQTSKNLEHAGGWLKGRTIDDYPAISARLHDRFPHNKSAVAAVEMAVFDALTRHLNIPLWRLWSSKPKTLRADITVVIADLEETKEKTRAFYKKGFRAFKIKIGRDMDLDFKRVMAVNRLAPGSQMILDANQGYSARQTLQFLKDLQKAGLVPDLIEQPVPKADWEGLQKVTRETKVCVCADESASSLADALRIIKARAAGAINIKLMKTGIVHAVEISRLARAAGIKLMIGGMMESNLAMTASAHLAAGLGCFDFIDLDTPFFIKGEVGRNPYLSSNGTYDLSMVKAGIGIDL